MLNPFKSKHGGTEKEILASESHKKKAIHKSLTKAQGGMLGKLKQMQSEPASKEWFKKHGLPKGIKNHPLKNK